MVKNTRDHKRDTGGNPGDIFHKYTMLDSPLRQSQSVLAMIETFNKDVVIPALQEKKVTLERKGNKFTIFPKELAGSTALERR